MISLRFFRPYCHFHLHHFPKRMPGQNGKSPQVQSLNFPFHNTRNQKYIPLWLLGIRKLNAPEKLFEKFDRPEWQ